MLNSPVDNIQIFANDSLVCYLQRIPILYEIESFPELKDKYFLAANSKQGSETTPPAGLL